MTSTDVAVVLLAGGAANSANYGISVNMGSGSFGVTVRNLSGGSLSEALVLNFVIIKGVNA